MALSTVEIADVVKYGSIRDQPGYMLPPEAWTLALNMQINGEGLEKMFGWVTGVVPHPPLAAPAYVIPALAQGFDLSNTDLHQTWVYLSLTKAFVFDPTIGLTANDEITGSPDFTTQFSEQWQHTQLGSVLIINNGVDIPRQNMNPRPDSAFALLQNWPTEVVTPGVDYIVRAKIIRAFGPFLVAFNIRKAGGLTRLPHMVKWSHPADPGSVPISWDHTDPTRDAGEVELPDHQAGVIVEALPLGDTMFIYKENSIWRMRFIGGRFIFDVGKAAWVTTQGCIAMNCVGITSDGTRHIVCGQDDIYWHNGSQVVSILTDRQRRRLFDEFDTNNAAKAFMMDYPSRKQMYFCYPTSGSVYPNRALVIHYGRGEPWPITEMDGVTFRGGTMGETDVPDILEPGGETWEDAPTAWTVDDGPWSTQTGAGQGRRRLVTWNTDASKIYIMDQGSTRDGLVFNGTAQRTGLSLLGRKRSGEWIVDYQVMKLFDEIWPKLQGGPVNLRLGVSKRVEGPTLWGNVDSFNPATDISTYLGPVSGRAGAVEYSSSNWFRIDGYKLVLAKMGEWPTRIE